MTRPFRYFTSCVDTTPAQYETLRELIDSAETITRETFMRHVDPADRRQIEQQLGYALHPSEGLTIARDWHVSYFRSTWDGQRAYGFVWSAIEHIFTIPARQVRTDFQTKGRNQ